MLDSSNSSGMPPSKEISIKWLSLSIKAPTSSGTHMCGFYCGRKIGIVSELFITHPPSSTSSVQSREHESLLFERLTQQQAESDIDRCHSTTRAVGWVLHSLVKVGGSRTPLPQTKDFKEVEASIMLIAHTA